MGYRCRACADNGTTLAGYIALLKSAVEGPAFQWIGSIIRHVAKREALEAAGLPQELAGEPKGIMPYLRQLHAAGIGMRRASLTLVGPQAVGKTSLIWRLKHPDSSSKLETPGSTDGIQIGE